MANRAFKRQIATLDTELVLINGQVILSSSGGGIGQSNILVNGLTGSLPTVLSGSSPNQFNSTFTVQRVTSGSYRVKLADVYAKLQRVELCIGFSGSSAPTYMGYGVIHDTGVPGRYDTTSSSGFNQFGFTIVNNASGSFSAVDPTSTPLTINISLALANTSA